MIEDMFAIVGIIAISSFIYFMYDRYEDYKISKDKPNKFEYNPTLKDYDNIIDNIKKASLAPSNSSFIMRRWEQQNYKDMIEFIENIKRNTIFDKEDYYEN